MRIGKIQVSIIIFFITGMFSILIRSGIPSMGLDAKASDVWIEILFTIIFYVCIMLIALGWGDLVLRKFTLNCTQLEYFLLSIIVGLGVISTGLFFLGLLKCFTKDCIFIYLLLAGIIAYVGLSKTLFVPFFDLSKYQHPSYFEFFLSLMVVGLILLSFIESLAPPWDYDALFYHLEIPKQFLNQGKIFFDENVVRSSYPFLTQMLFSTGIAFGLDSLSRLVHFTYSLLWLGSIYAFSTRFFSNKRIALITLAILVGTPSFTAWSNFAGIDFSWSTYEFWSVYSLIIGLTIDKKNIWRWVAMAGLMSGFAASTKYLSLVSFLIIIFLLVIYLIKTKSDIRNSIKMVILLGGCAGLIMSPWYFKNLILTGNPVYPLLFGGPGWDPLENKIWNDYIYSFGMPKNLLNTFLLPLYIYIHQSRFATSILEIIHPALWLAALFPLLKRSRISGLRIAFLYTILYAVYWVFSAHVIRFILPFSAFLAVFAAAVIEHARTHIKYILRFTLVSAFLVYSLLLSLVYANSINLMDYYLGNLSKRELLLNSVGNLAFKLYITENLNSDDRVQFLWDGRGYYCDSRCIPDDEQSNAVLLSYNWPQPKTLADQLEQKGITHILLSRQDAYWFIEFHDPDNDHEKALQYFDNVFMPQCGKLIVKNEGAQLYQIDCQP